MAHILLIDDDATLRETFGALARRLGHDVTWAGSLEEGRQALGRGRFDVALLDLGLPDGYGLDLMPAIKPRQAARKSSSSPARTIPKARPWPSDPVLGTTSKNR